MHKSIFLGLALTVFATFLVKQAFDVLGIDHRSRPSLAAGDTTRPSFELRWSGVGSRNRIAFTPAPAFPFLVGSTIAITVASMAVGHLRSA